MNNLLSPLILILIISFIIAIILVFFNKRFNVENNDKNIKTIEDLLPGINCGACGYVNCKNFAKALVEEKNLKVDVCKVIKDDKKEEIKRKLKKIAL